jgi:hypothetical protein
MAKSKLRQLVRFPWAADSFPWVGKLRTVLPFTNRDVTRDSAVLNLNRGQVLRFATCLTAGRVGSAVQWVVRREPARVDTSRAVGCPRRHRSGSHVARGARLAAPRHHCDHPRRRWVRLYPGARRVEGKSRWATLRARGVHSPGSKVEGGWQTLLRLPRKERRPLTAPSP